MTLEEWNEALASALDVDDLELDTTAILDLARDAAHEVHRVAAPLTTFIVGYAAARRGGSPEDIAACIGVAADLAARSSSEDATDGQG